jgi:4-hydroxy-4-methyl-2-oxoglutarate aldolase
MDTAKLNELIELLKTGSAAAAYEAIGKRGDLDTAIVALVPNVRCVGPAFTVKGHPHHSGGLSPSVDFAPPGCVIVVDAGVDGGTCAFGGTASLAAKLKGVAGVVTNGYVRDVAEMRELQFPVFARGGTVRSGRKEPTAERNVPVSVGGQIIHPGDLVIGDDDGVVVIAQEYFATLAQALSTRLAFEREADAKVRAGMPYGEAIANRPAVA